MTKYSKGLTPSAIQHKYKLTYEQGFELATIINNQQTEINRLREALKSVKQQTINLGDYEEIGAIATISDICDKALNSKSEGK